MPNNVIQKKVVIKGNKGDRGSAGSTDTTIPMSGIVAYDGEEIPEGYTLYYDTDEGGE